MSDEDALLAAIAAHPDEDTPRLMYADWLQEHGRAIRAEFIRVQVELAQKEHLPRAVLNRYVHIFERNQELIDNHRAELLGPLAHFSEESRIEFRRGFVSEVTVFTHEFFENRDALSTFLPRPRVTVTGATGPIRHFLGFNVHHHYEFPRLELVTAIRTWQDSAPDDFFDADDYAALEPESWPRLDELDISGCRLGDALAGQLLTPSSFPLLSNLDLSGNDLTNFAVGALLNTSLPRQLKRLILGGNDITDAGAVALATRWPTGEGDKLENLNLRFTHIGQAGQAALLRRFGGRVDLF